MFFDFQSQFTFILGCIFLVIFELCRKIKFVESVDKCILSGKLLDQRLLIKTIWHSFFILLQIWLGFLDFLQIKEMYVKLLVWNYIWLYILQGLRQFFIKMIRIRC